MLRSLAGKTRLVEISRGTTATNKGSEPTVKGSVPADGPGESALCCYGLGVTVIGCWRQLVPAPQGALDVAARSAAGSSASSLHPVKSVIPGQAVPDPLADPDVWSSWVKAFADPDI